MSDLKQDLASLKLPEPGTLQSKRRRRWPLVLAVVVPLVAYFGWRSANAAVEVETVTPTVERGPNAMAGTPELTASGYVVARRQAVVSAKIQGRLSELAVEEGDRVQEGEVFARLESQDFQAAVARARATLARAGAQIQSAEAQVSAARAQIARAEADLAEMRRQLRVAEKLAADELVPTDDVEAARSRVNVSEAAVRQAQADLERAQSEVARARADRTQAQADVQYNDALLQNTVIRAPFTGTVVRKMAEVGESVAPIPPGVNISTASGAIVALADLDTLEVEVDVAEANVAQLDADQPAEVIVEAFPETKYRGTLRQVIPTADRTRATVMVKVTILNADSRLKPEMSAKVTFLRPATPGAAPAGEVILVPQAAVVIRDGASSVFVVVDGEVQARPVVLGENVQDRVIVTEGLDGREVLVARPADDLEAGARVRVRSTAS